MFIYIGMHGQMYSMFRYSMFASHIKWATIAILKKSQTRLFDNGPITKAQFPPMSNIFCGSSIEPLGYGLEEFSHF